MKIKEKAKAKQRTIHREPKSTPLSFMTANIDQFFQNVYRHT